MTRTCRRRCTRSSHPNLPERLTPGQAAQLSELLEYIHIRLRNLISTAQSRGGQGKDRTEFSPLAESGRRSGSVAEYLRQIGNPE